MIDIKDTSNNNRLSTQVNEGSIYKYTLLKEEYILLKFSVENPIYFRLGDYTDIYEGLFEIVDLVFPTYNKSTGGYDYDLRMDAHYWKWKHKKLFYDRQKGKEAKWSLTRTPDAHMSIVVSNIAALGYTYKGKPYVFSMDATVKMEPIFIQYDNTNIIDGISMIAEACGCEWWVKENYIFLGHCEDTIKDVITLEMGNELSDMTRSDSTSTYATRIISFGSERNIPKNYRSDSDDLVIEGVVQRRLKLPEGIPYVDAYPDMTTEEAVENVVLFDNVYPRRIGTISEVNETRGNIVDENGKPTGETYPIFTIRDAGLKNFKKEYLLDELRFVFQSGSMNGMHFALELKSSDDTGTVFEIERNQNYGQFLPNDIMKPEKDGTYILYGYDTSFISDTLIGEAEQELLEETQKYVEKSKIDPSVYTCPTNPVRCAGYIDGKHNQQKEIDLEIGHRVKLINKAFFKDGRESRIYGFEKKLDNPFECTYTIGESTQYSRIGDIENRLDELKYNGNTYVNTGGSGGIYIIKTNDPTISTDQNVYSALMTDRLINNQNSNNENKFIRKDKPDGTDYLLTARGGINIGDFISGLLGSGARINEKGEIEARSLQLWESLDLPELRFNRVDVIAGETWNAIAFGLIESVDTVNQIVTLKLEDGELSGMHLSDFCRGIFHNLTGNETTSGTDSAGFKTMVGFSTAYFTPVEIIDNAHFRYELKPGTTVHPCVSMKYAVYGNPTIKERQHSSYSTRTYIRFLRNVNTWEIYPDKNISSQWGDLSDLTINGESLKDGSIYLNNVYFGGNVWSVPGLDSGLKGLDAYSVTLSTYSAVYNTKDGLTEQVDVVSGGNNVVTGSDQVVTQDFRITTKIQVTKGTELLRYSTVLGTGKYLVNAVGTGCTFTVTDGLVVVHSVTEEKAEIKLEINCEGLATYEQVFTVVRVIDGVDGTDVEWIFKRSPAEANKPSRPATSENTDDYVPNGWTDDPVGPDINNPFEWSCKREKTNGIWGSFSDVFLWSKFGKDGTGVQNIYSVTKNYAPPALTNSQDDDYVPFDWYSTPIDVTSEWKIGWMSQRTKKDGRWSNFSSPIIYTKYVTDGENGTDGLDGWSIFRFYKISESRPPAPTSAPPSGWSVDPPTGEGIVWATECHGRIDESGNITYKDDFTTPVQMTGQKGDDGSRGPFMTFRRKYDPTKQYTGSTTHVDAVYTEDSSGNKTYWVAKPTAGIFSAKVPNTSSAYWEAFQGQFESIATGLALIEEANIAGWWFSDLVIESQNRNCVIDGNADDHPRIALGANYANRDNAPTRLYEDGSVFFEKGVFGGYLQVAFKELSSSDATRVSGTIYPTYKLVEDLNIKLRAGNYADGYQVHIQLPSSLSYEGKIVTIYESSFPPYTKSSSWLYITTQNGYGIGGCQSQSVAETDRADPVELRANGVCLQFIAVRAVDVYGADYIKWIALNYK